MPTYCIICGKEKNGIPVANDRILDSLRWFKRNITKNEQKNKLVVCREDYPQYKKNRDRFMFRMSAYLIIGILFLIMALLVSPSIGTLIVGICVVAGLYLLSLLNYTPGLELETGKKAKKPKAQ